MDKGYSFEVDPNGESAEIRFGGLDGTITKADVEVEFGVRSLRVAVQGKTLAIGRLAHPIYPEESLWLFSTGTLVVELATRGWKSSELLDPDATHDDASGRKEPEKQVPGDSDDPFAALAAFAEGNIKEEVQEDDPFAALESFATGKTAKSTAAVESLDDLFAAVESSASSLATVVTGFLAEDFGIVVQHGDDKLEALGVTEDVREALVQWLGANVDKALAGLSLSAARTFGDMVAVCDRALRRHTEAKAADLQSLLVPLEDTPAVANVAPEAKGETPEGTPKTRRRGLVEKGIGKFQGMTLRGRTPEQQEQRRREMQARLAKKK